MQKNDSKQDRAALNHKPALAVFAVVFFYILTEALSSTLMRVVSPENHGLSIFIKLLFFSVFTFVAVPCLLRLPAGKTTFRTFLERIGLKSPLSFGQILLITASCYAIFIIFQSLGAIIFHQMIHQKYVLDFSRHGLLDTGSIIAGIFEEIVFRGVIVAVLLRKFSERKTMLLSASIFAGLHLLNIFNPETVKIWVLCQVIWAFGLGIMYAFMLIRLKSLLPLIFIHYLINAFAGVWFKGLDTQNIISGLYGIPFFGILPAALAILWIYYLSHHRKFNTAKHKT